MVMLASKIQELKLAVCVSQTNVPNSKRAITAPHFRISRANMDFFFVCVVYMQQPKQSSNPCVMCVAAGR